MDIYACYAGGQLIPCGDDAHEALHNLKSGEIYKVKISDGRNYQFHKKYFALINTAFEFLDESLTAFYGNSNTFRKAVEVAAGYFDMCYNINTNQWMQCPRSIAFDKMDQHTFNELYERVKDVILKCYIPSGNHERFMKILTF